MIAELILAGATITGPDRPSARGGYGDGYGSDTRSGCGFGIGAGRGYGDGNGACDIAVAGNGHMSPRYTAKYETIRWKDNDTMTPREAIRRYAATLRPMRGPVADDYERANQERRDAIDDALVMLTLHIAGPSLHHGPTPEVAARIILGAKPTDLAPWLTRREAGQWVSQNQHETPLAWLWAQIVSEHPVLERVTMPRSFAVARWVCGVMRDPERAAAAARTRTGRIGEEEVEGSVLDRLDELIAADLRASPVATIEVAAQRIAEAAWDGPDELTPHEPWHDRLHEGITVLRTYSALHTEGRECRHCAAVYAEAVRAGECIMVRVLAPDGTRSTAEIVDGKVVQHKGPRNEQPSPACVALLARAQWT